MHEVYAKQLCRKERREKWKALILSYYAGELTKKEFSKIHGLKGRDLSRWIRRLNLSSAKSSHQAEEGVVNPEICGNFVEVKMEPSALPFLSKVKLKHISGFSLEVKETTDERILKKLLKLLMETRPC